MPPVTYLFFLFIALFTLVLIVIVLRVQARGLGSSALPHVTRWYWSSKRLALPCRTNLLYHHAIIATYKSTSDPPPPSHISRVIFFWFHFLIEGINTNKWTLVIKNLILYSQSHRHSSSLVWKPLVEVTEHFMDCFVFIVIVLHDLCILKWNNTHELPVNLLCGFKKQL